MFYTIFSIFPVTDKFNFGLSILVAFEASGNNNWENRGGLFYEIIHASDIKYYEYLRENLQIELLKFTLHQNRAAKGGHDRHQFYIINFNREEILDMIYGNKFKFTKIILLSGCYVMLLKSLKSVLIAIYKFHLLKFWLIYFKVNLVSVI